MAMGMSPEEYWNGDPYLTVVYRKMWDIRKDQQNEAAWWQGLYIYDALATIAHNLTKRKGEKRQTYPTKPYELEARTEEQKAAKKKQAQKEAIDYFNSLKTKLENKYGR